MDDYNVSQYRKDRLGEIILISAAGGAIALLSVAGVLEKNWWYFLWAVVISLVWGEAMYAREPKKYRNRGSRRLLFLTSGMMIIFMVSLITIVLKDPNLLVELLVGPQPTPTIDPASIPTETPQPLVTATPPQGFVQTFSFFR